MKISFLLFFAFHFVFSQHFFLAYPKVNKEDLTKKASSIDSNAEAEILYKSVHNLVDTNGILTTTVVEKIKIYNKDKAGKFLDKEIPLYKSNNSAEEQISSFKAITHNLENENISETKVEKNSRFSSKEDKNFVLTKFAFPNVKDGSVLELNYSVTSPFLHEIDKVIIEEEIPIVYAEYVLDAPNKMGYSINYLGSLIPKHRKVTEQIMYGSNYRTYRFGYEDIPTFKTEEHVINHENYKTTIRAELNSITRHDNSIENFATSWNDVREKLYYHDDFGQQLKRTGLVKKLLPDEILSIKNDVDRANEIFKYVQKNFNWDKKYGVLTENGIKETLQNKSGNIADINLLLVMLMREANIKAHPIVLASVSRGRIVSFLPSITRLNYVIAGVEANNDEIYIYDATSKFTKQNLIHPRAYNQKGYLLLNEKGKKEAKEINLENISVSNNNYTVQAKLLDNRKFSGSVENTVTNMYSLLTQEEFVNNESDYEKKFKSKYKFPLQNFKSSVLENGDFQNKFTFESDGFVDELDNKIIFNPLLFLYSQSHSFDQKQERKQPIELVSAYQNTKKINIELPKGYKFVDIPKSKKIKTQDDGISYSYIVDVKEDKIEIETKTLVDSTFFEKEYYPALKQIFDAVVKYESQMVSVSKK